MARLSIRNVGLAALGCLIAGFLLHAPPLVPSFDLSEAIAIPLPQSALHKQLPYACGPYSAAAALNAVGITADPVQIKNDMWLFFQGRGTLPWGMHLALWNAGASTRSLWLERLTNEERIKVLYAKLQDGHPVIALVHMHNYPHYIVLLGYNPSSHTFNIYDPLHGGSEGGQTTDSNGAAAGNRQISSDALFAAWEQGSIYGLYRWYGIAVH